MRHKEATSILDSKLKALSDWYLNHKRDLPWHNYPTPYTIWISEVMSQQSTLKTVIPFFERWMKQFPDLSSLSESSEQKVLLAWSGLGYYSRARNILKSAQKLQMFYQKNGAWPQSVDEWMALPGIGPYTSRAICSIAFEQKVLPIDGNVLRVLSRVWNIENPLNSSKDFKKIEKRSQAMMDRAPNSLKASNLSQAFMELGATVCRPGTQAQCLLCPLAAACQALKLSKVAALPISKNRIKIEEKIQIAVVYRNQKTAILMRQIPPDKRLKGQFELPLWNLETTGQAHNIINKICKKFEVLGPIKHSITRYRYTTYLVLADLWSPAKVPEGHVFWHPDASKQKLLTTTLTRKLLKLLNF